MVKDSELITSTTLYPLNGSVNQLPCFISKSLTNSSAPENLMLITRFVAVDLVGFFGNVKYETPEYQVFAELLFPAATSLLNVE